MTFGGVVLVAGLALAVEGGFPPPPEIDPTAGPGANGSCERGGRNRLSRPGAAASRLDPTRGHAGSGGRATFPVIKK